MKKRATKEWNGGVRPELSETDKAWASHVDGCPACTKNPLVGCDEGAKLYKAVHAQYETKIRDANAAAYHGDIDGDFGYW